MGNELNHGLREALPAISTVYGVDIAADYIAIVRVQKTRKGPHATTLIAESIADEPPALQSILQELQAESSLGQALVAAAMPVSASSVRWLTAPYASIAKAQRVFPALLDIELPLPLESCVADFLDLHVQEGKVRALATVAPRAEIEKRLERLRSWHLDPAILDHEGLALWTDHQQSQATPLDQTDVILYVGSDRTIWIGGRGQHLLGTQSYPHGFNTLSGQPGHIDGDAVRSWRDRATRHLRSWQDNRSTKPLHIFWTGPGATQTALLAALQGELSELGAQHHVIPDASSHLARSLAMRLFTRKSINFRSAVAPHPQIIKLKQRHQRSSMAIALASAAILASLNLGSNYLIQRRLAEANAQIVEAARDITGLSRLPPRQERLLADRAFDERKAQMAPILAHFEPPLAADVYWLLSTAAKHGWTVQSLRLDDVQMELRGTASGRAEIRALEGDLQQRGWRATTRTQPGIDPQFLDITLRAERSQ